VARNRLSAQAVADLVGGRLVGDGAVALDSVGPLDRAGPTTLSFLVSGKYLPYFRASSAGAVLLPEYLVTEPEGPVTRIVVPEPYRALQQVVPALYPVEPTPPGVDPTARLGAGVELGPDVHVGPHVVLGRKVRVGARTQLGPGVVLEDEVTVGEDCRIGPYVVCYRGVEIGSRVIIKAASVFGGIGFGYATGSEGHTRIPHIGRCVLEDDVEIGSHTCVDRGSVDDTVIGRGTKIDNLVQVAHNCRIGERCLIMATSGIAGSVQLGREVIVGGGVGIADHVQIGDRSRVAARSGIFGSWPGGITVGGYPARNHREWLRSQVAIYRLSPIMEELEAMVKERRPGATSHD